MIKVNTNINNAKNGVNFEINQTLNCYIWNNIIRCCNHVIIILYIIQIGNSIKDN